MEQLNPLLDYSVKDIIIVNDGLENNSEENIILNHIVELFTNMGFSYKDHLNYSLDQIRELNAETGNDDRKNFEALFDDIKDKIDLETLLSYTQKQNPDFFQQLNESSRSLLEILWGEYQKRAHKEDSLHFDSFNLLLQDARSVYPNAHIIMPFLNHNLLTFALHTKGSINYHAISRGFYAFGGAIPIKEKEDGKEKERFRYSILFSLAHINELDIQDKKSYITEIFLHEVLGHMISNLPDHHDANGGNCVMTTRWSISQLLETAKQRKGDYFCESCEKPVSSYFK
jgi:hypothetical protein